MNSDKQSSKRLKQIVIYSPNTLGIKSLPGKSVGPADSTSKQGAVREDKAITRQLISLGAYFRRNWENSHIPCGSLYFCLTLK